MTDTIVLVDFSGLAWTCWEPALSAQEAGERALAEHRAKCASCELGDPCPTKPRQYDAKKVLFENIDLKFGTLIESINVPVKTWVMVKDGKDARRRQLWPAYKMNREQKPFDPRPLAEEHIRSKGARFCWSPEAEADDAIATMAKVLSEGVPEAGIRPKKVIIVSSDKDLWQVWNPPLVEIYLTTKKEFLTKEYVHRKFPDRSKTSKVPGIDSVKHVRLCKALWGDPSDNIPNAMPRMQGDLTPLIKESDGTLDHFLSLCTDVRLGDKVMGKLDAARNQIRTNWEVVGLYLDVPVVWLNNPQAP